MVRQFHPNQSITVCGTAYTIEGMIWFQEDDWEWQEYKLRDTYGNIKWLSVEEDEDDGSTCYSMYEECWVDATGKDENFIDENGEVYTRYEQGRAVVKKHFGSVDVDTFERCYYKEYIDKTGKKYISFETWDDELEKSRGYSVDEWDVVADDDYGNQTNASSEPSYYANGRSKNSGCVLKLLPILLVCTILAFFIGILSNMNSKVLSKFLEKNAKFTYVTSVTSNTTKNKAKVYSCSESVDGTVQIIIDGLGSKVKSVTEYTDSDDAADEDGIGIETSKEYAYVYTSEDGITYVQVSNRKFVSEGNQNAYRSRYGNHHYTRVYRSGYASSRFLSYLNSARQGSTTSRNSSGGGTSYGK